MHLIFPPLLLPSLFLGPESLIFKLLHAGLEVKTKELQLNKNAINFSCGLLSTGLNTYIKEKLSHNHGKESACPDDPRCLVT